MLPEPSNPNVRVTIATGKPLTFLEVTLVKHSIASLQQIEDLAASLHNECRSNCLDQYAYVSPVLFRGHSRADWRLDTTLERFGKPNLELEECVRYLSKVKPGIEAYTEKAFSFNCRNDMAAGHAFPLSQVSFLNGQYEFMVYLRHHGFPSPLLDWSRSLYVALYFACSGPDQGCDAALYMYVESLGFGKGGCVGTPEIATLGQYVSAHKRHFTQQSEYTACIAKNPDGRWLEKVLIPGLLRKEILRRSTA
jgi:hypothetical protein